MFKSILKCVTFESNYSASTHLPITGIEKTYSNTIKVMNTLVYIKNQQKQ